MTDDGKPYSVERFKQITKERYFISKQINTSYVDVGYVTPLEREFMLQYIQDELEQRTKAFEEMKSKQ